MGKYLSNRRFDVDVTSGQRCMHTEISADRVAIPQHRQQKSIDWPLLYLTLDPHRLQAGIFALVTPDKRDLGTPVAPSRAHRNVYQRNMLHTTLVERISDQSFQVHCAILQHEDFTALESAILEVYFGSNDHIFEDYLL